MCGLRGTFRLAARYHLLLGHVGKAHDKEGLKKNSCREDSLWVCVGGCIVYVSVCLLVMSKKKLLPFLL